MIFNGVFVKGITLRFSGECFWPCMYINVSWMRNDGVWAKRLIYKKVLYSSAQRVPRHLAIPSLRLLFPRKVAKPQFSVRHLLLFWLPAPPKKRILPSPIPDHEYFTFAEIFVLNAILLLRFIQMNTLCSLIITNKEDLVFAILEQFCMNWILSII